MHDGYQEVFYPELPGRDFDHRVGRSTIANVLLDDRQLVSKLRENPAFSTLPDSAVQAVLDCAKSQVFSLGSVILRKGARGSGLFVLKRGRVRVVDDSDPTNPLTLAVLSAGEVFGERSLLFDAPVNATVRSAGEIEVLALPPSAFRQLVAEQPEIARSMVETIRRYDRFNFIRSVPLFAGLTNTDIEHLNDTAESIVLQKDEMLIDEAAPIESLWIVESGELRISIGGRPPTGADSGADADVDARPADLLVRIIRATDSFGLKGVMNAAATSEAVQSRRATRLLGWPVHLFRELAAQNASVAKRFGEAAELEQDQLATVLAAPTAPVVSQPAYSRDLPRASKRRLSKNWFSSSLDVYHLPDERLHGLACLQTAAACFGQRAHVDHLLEEQSVGRSPETLVSLARKAEEAGMLSRLVRVAPEDIGASMIPFIFMAAGGELKVAVRVSGEKVTIADPATGELATISRRVLAKVWTGEALAIAVVPDFGALGASRASLFVRFLPILRPHFGALAKLIVLSLLTLIVGVLLPLFTQTIIDHVLIFDDRPLLVLLLVCTLFASLMSLLANGARSLLTIRVASLINAVLMARLFSHVLAAPLSKLRKWNTGDISMRFNENEKILGLATAVAEVLVLDVIAVLVFTLVMLSISPALTAVSLVFVALIALVLLRASPHLRANDMAVFDSERRLQSHLIEMFEGIETIKYASQETDFASRGKSLLRETSLAEIKGARLSFRIELAATALAAFASLTIFSLGGAMVLAGSLSAGAMVAFAGLLGGLMGPMQKIAGIYDSIQELRIALGRVNDLLSIPREQPGGGVACPMIRGQVRFENVSFSYDSPTGEKVLHDIDLEIAAGQKVAVVGPSGSGKSTLVKLINRLVEPTEGRVLIDEIDIARIEPSSLRRQIGVVEQSPYIFAGTIRDNIAKASPDMPFDRITTVARLSGAADFISAFPMGYNTRIGEGGRSLSGGQSQRLVIARALANDPGILILDEATSALDNESEQAVQRSLDAALVGRTVFAIAHRLSTIRNADLILVLQAGRIVERGNHETLLAMKGLYHRLVMSGERAHMQDEVAP